jgi:CBS domain-containing protein
MARYGRDYGRDRWIGGGGYGQGGYGGGSYGTGGGSSRGGEYGGMGSDASYGGGSQYNAGHSGFGSGGGAYDNDFNPGGYGAYGYGATPGGGTNRGGYGGQDYGGYGAETGFSGGYGGGGSSDWSRGRDSQQRGGGHGYGGGGYTSGGGQGYGGAGYTSGGQGYGYGGYGGGSDMGGGSSYGSNYGGSQLSGQQDEVRRLRAADVMTDNPECVTPETTLADAARKMRDLDVGIIPVVESDSSKRLKGVLTDRDIAIRAVADGKDANTTRVMEVMTTQVETCNKNDSLRDVLSVMEREQVRRVPITDREGRLVGIIAQADVATEVATPQGQRSFADTVESISEPGNPRGRWGGRPSQGRGGGGGGVLGAVRSAVSSLGGGQRESYGGGMGATGGTGARTASGGATGNNDPRAMNDPGSENV